jgi:PhnB protein
MEIDVYLNYAGRCEEAFRFYEQHLGGRIVSMMRHRDLPGPSQMPEDWRDTMLHARIEIGGLTLMGADMPQAEPMRSAYLTLRVESDDEADRLYALLTDGGEVFMKIAATFFASRFAMFRDRFGTSWMLLHERPAASPGEAGRQS